MVEGAARLGTWLPFERAAEFVRLFTGVRVSGATVRRLTEGTGAAYEAVQTAEAARLERSCPAPPSGPEVQQLSVDGAMVPLRGKGAWAEVKTLAIGTVAPVVDGAAGAGSVGGGAPPDAPVTPDTRVAQLSYFSRLAEHATFSRLATVETHRRGTETAGVVCGVVDGAEWCQQFLDAHRPDAVRILDFCHAAGYLAQLAQAAFGEGTVEAATWYEQQRHLLRHDDSRDAPDTVLAAAATLRAVLGARGAPAATLELATTAVAYLTKRRDQLRYARFARLGYPIGSGIAESANKLVVEARLKGAGMHWARANVNPLLALRGAACSDRWDEAWPQLAHRLRNARREHAARRRADRATPAARRPYAPPSAPPPAVQSTRPTPALPAAAAVSAPVAVTAPPPDRSRVPRPNHPWRRLPAGVGAATRVRFYRGRLSAKT